ncbi:LacI family DNA-binding transcriptional regulator [Flavimarina sp. Hel_I_48]|uniref:LacI family DNA-binding transcriptional regulator n=1 Tax=Flavimarina sp. Hel_I_48 TaxID=1392488 RepID=UPI0004DEED4C|nr:LacI family DNA-binding transcriptional regulator [Flavimarina sp. Hel_I_48]
MKKGRTSIKDIANALNVSVTTISFVLNGKGKEKKISDAVIKKVIDYTESINYKPNRVAQSLRTGESKIIVFMVEDIGNYFFAKLARIIEDIAYKKDYKVLFCSNENDDARSRELIDLFYERRVDGFIIIPSGGIRNDIAQLIDKNIPVVLFDRYFEDLNTSAVVINNEDAAFKATNKLIAGAFKNIAFITTDAQQMQMRGRLEGYKRAIKEANLEPNVLQVPYLHLNSEKRKSLIREFFKNQEELDAVFFSTNYLTQHGLEIIRELEHLDVFKLGIVAFDDNDFFKIHSPSISAVAQPLKQMGEEIMKIMLKMLKEKNNRTPTKQIVLDARFIERESSRIKIPQD